jgi:hypothetical protein
MTTEVYLANLVTQVADGTLGRCSMRPARVGWGMWSPHSVGVIIRRLRDPPDLRHEHEPTAMDEALGITQAAPAHEASPGISSTVLRRLGT